MTLRVWVDRLASPTEPVRTQTDEAKKNMASNIQPSEIQDVSASDKLELTVAVHAIILNRSEWANELGVPMAKKTSPICPKHDGSEARRQRRI